jgi:hypothetical protein
VTDTFEYDELVYKGRVAEVHKVGLMMDDGKVVQRDLIRYELHRVWVVDANLKEGTRHIYKRRTFYIDEDSWQVLVVDCYDTRDQIWRVQEGLGINYYDQPSYWTTLELVYDLQSGRYLAIGLNNEEPITYDFTKTYELADFSPGSLRRTGVR